MSRYSTMAEPRASFAKLCALLVLSPITAIINGWCLSIIWGWFIVPLGVPEIGIAHAIGIAIVVGAFTMDRRIKDERDTAEQVITALALMPIVTLFASVAYAFM